MLDAHRVPADTLTRLHQALATAQSESAQALYADEGTARAHLARLQEALRVSEWLLQAARLGLTPAEALQMNLSVPFPACPGPLV